jgi:hypothetical protein
MLLRQAGVGVCVAVWFVLGTFCTANITICGNTSEAVGDGGTIVGHTSNYFSETKFRSCVTWAHCPSSLNIRAKVNASLADGTGNVLAIGQTMRTVYNDSRATPSALETWYAGNFSFDAEFNANALMFELVSPDSNYSQPVAAFLRIDVLCVTPSTLPVSTKGCHDKSVAGFIESSASSMTFASAADEGSDNVLHLSNGTRRCEFRIRCGEGYVINVTFAGTTSPTSGTFLQQVSMVSAILPIWNNADVAFQWLESNLTFVWQQGHVVYGWGTRPNARLRYVCVLRPAMVPVAPACVPGTPSRQFNDTRTMIASDMDGPGPLQYAFTAPGTCFVTLQCPVGRHVRIYDGHGSRSAVALRWADTGVDIVDRYPDASGSLDASLRNATFRANTMTIDVNQIDGYLTTGFNFTWTCVPALVGVPLRVCGTITTPFEVVARSDLLWSDSDGYGPNYHGRDCYIRITCPNQTDELDIVGALSTPSVALSGPPYHEEQYFTGRQGSASLTNRVRWRNFTALLRTYGLGAIVEWSCQPPRLTSIPSLRVSTNASEPVSLYGGGSVWVDADGGLSDVTPMSDSGVARRYYYRLQCPNGSNVHIDRIVGGQGQYDNSVEIVETKARFAHGIPVDRNFTVRGWNAVTIVFAVNFLPTFDLDWSCKQESLLSVDTDPLVLGGLPSSPFTLVAASDHFVADPDGEGTLPTTFKNSGSLVISVQCPTGFIGVDVNITAKTGVDGVKLDVFNYPRQRIPANRATSLRYFEPGFNVTMDWWASLNTPAAGFRVRFSCLPDGTPIPMPRPEFRCAAINPVVLTDPSRPILSDMDGGGPLMYPRIPASAGCLWVLQCPSDKFVRIDTLLGGTIGNSGAEHKLGIQFEASVIYFGAVRQFDLSPVVIRSSSSNVSFFGQYDPSTPVDDVTRPNGFNLSWSCADPKQYDGVIRGCPAASAPLVSRDLTAAFQHDTDGAGSKYVVWTSTACAWRIECPSNYMAVVFDNLHVVQAANSIRVIPSDSHSFGIATQPFTLIDRQYVGYPALYGNLTVLVSTSISSPVAGGVTINYTCLAPPLRPEYTLGAVANPGQLTVSTPTQTVTNVLERAAGVVRHNGFDGRAVSGMILACPNPASEALFITQLSTSQWSSPIILAHPNGTEVLRADTARRTNVALMESLVVVNASKLLVMDQFEISWECRCRVATGGLAGPRLACGSNCAGNGTIVFAGDNTNDACLCNYYSEDYMCAGNGHLVHGPASVVPAHSRILSPRGDVLPCVCQCRFPWYGPRCDKRLNPIPPTQTASASDTESWTATITRTHTVPLPTPTTSRTPPPTRTPTFPPTDSPSSTLAMSTSQSVTDDGTASLTDDEWSQTAAGTRTQDPTRTKEVVPSAPPVELHVSALATTVGGLSTSAAAMFVGAGIASGGASGADVQALGLVGLVDCMNPELKTAARGAAKSILPLSIGDTESRNLAGLFALVGGVTALHVIVVLFLPVVATRTVSTSLDAAVKARFPEVSLRVGALAVQGFAYELMRVVQMPPAFQTVLAGLFAVVGLLTIVLVLLWARGRVVRDLLFEPYTVGLNALPRPLRALPVFAAGYWLPSKHSKRFGVVFNSCRPGRLGFAFATPIRNILVAGVAAVAADTTTECQAQLYAMAAVMVSYALVTIATAPTRVRILTLPPVLNSITTAVVYVAPVTPFLQPHSATLYLVGMAANVVGAALQIVTTVVERQMRNREHAAFPDLEENLTKKRLAVMCLARRRLKAERRQARRDLVAPVEVLATPPPLDNPLLVLHTLPRQGMAPASAARSDSEDLAGAHKHPRPRLIRYRGRSFEDDDADRPPPNLPPAFGSICTSDGVAMFARQQAEVCLDERDRRRREARRTLHDDGTLSLQEAHSVRTRQARLETRKFRDRSRTHRTDNANVRSVVSTEGTDSSFDEDL